MSSKKREDKISLLDIGEKQRLTVTPIPRNVLVDESDFAPEKTPVIENQTTAFKEIAQMSKHVRGLVRATNNQAAFVCQIPELKDGIATAKEEVARANQKIDLVDVKLSTELKSTEKRVSRVEERVEDRSHECNQAVLINDLRESVKEQRRDSTESVKTQQHVAQQRKSLDDLKKKVEKVSTARRNFFMGLIGTAIFVLSTIGSLIWFLASIDTKVDAEQERWQERYKSIEKQIERIDKSSPSRTVCDSLSPSAIIKLKETLPRQEWPDCLE